MRVKTILVLFCYEKCQRIWGSHVTILTKSAWDSAYNCPYRLKKGEDSNGDMGKKRNRKRQG